MVMDRWVIVRGCRFPPKPGDNIIGRDPSAQAWLDDVGVSRRHARVAVTDSTSQIEDLGSKNGTYLRGVRVVEPIALRNGDVIRVGPVTVVYRMDAAGMTTETNSVSVEPSR